MATSKPPFASSGVYAALATPRRPDSTQADTAALLDYLEAIVHTGVDGLVLLSATGEFAHFEIDQRMRLLAFAVRRSRVPVLANVSHSTLAGAVALAHHAVQSGAAGVLLLPPYFDRYTDAQILQFYEEFIDRLGGTKLVYLYNLPLLTNRISPALADNLLSSGAFAGIKDSSGEWEMFEALNALRRKRDFKLLVGSESLYLRARLAGADGISSGIAAAIPELVVAIDSAISASDLARAHELDSRLQEFLAWLPNFPTTMAIKQAAVLRGWKHDDYAVPLDAGTGYVLAQFRAWLRDWIPMVLRECRMPKLGPLQGNRSANQ